MEGSKNISSFYERWWSFIFVMVVLLEVQLLVVTQGWPFLMFKPKFSFVCLFKVIFHLLP